MSEKNESVKTVVISLRSDPGIHGLLRMSSLESDSQSKPNGYLRVLDSFDVESDSFRH